MTPAPTGPGWCKLSPDTVPAQAYAGYDYDANRLDGFSHTRAVSVGCRGGGGGLHVSVGYAQDTGAWPMDKASEQAGTGWYGGGIRAELAAAGAVGRRASRSGTARVILDRRHSYSKRHGAKWERPKANSAAESVSN